MQLFILKKVHAEREGKNYLGNVQLGSPFLQQMSAKEKVQCPTLDEKGQLFSYTYYCKAGDSPTKPKRRAPDGGHTKAQVLNGNIHANINSIRNKTVYHVMLQVGLVLFHSLCFGLYLQ